MSAEEPVFEILVVRHAIAESAADAPGGDDFTRRLNDRGERRMRRVALGLRRIVDHLPLVAHSPLTRAVQTATILDAAFPQSTARREVAALAPGGDADAFLAWLAEASLGPEAEGGPIAVVGHEPELSHWIGYALCGELRPLVRMKKAAVCHLAFPGRPACERAHILGHYPPAVLSSLSEASW